MINQIPTYHQFRAVCDEFDKYVSQYSNDMRAMLKPYMQANGFVGESVQDSIEGFRELEAKYLSMDKRRKDFICSVPLKIRKKYQRQMRDERMAEKLSKAS